MLLVRLGGDVSTLLGPEGTTSCCCFRDLAGLLVWGLEVCQAWPGPAYRQLCVGFGVGRIGLWVGRLLRIAQWTRASLWSSCQGRTVNALAPGADEGRGRPR